MFAVLLVALLGMAALVIDVGTMWQARRNLVTATDAGALAAAQEYAIGGTGCATVAADFYGRNAPPDADAPTCSTAGQTVTVAGNVDVPFTFGRALGLTDGAITASTTALWQQPYSVSGLRPLGLCLDMLTAQGATPPVLGQTVHVPWNNDGPDTCSNGGSGNNIPGNWGYIDFDNTAGNPNNQISDWTANGYPDAVAPGIFDPFTGAHNNIANDLTPLIGQCITLPIYTKAEGNGGNAEFTIVDFASVILTDVHFTGQQNARYFEFTWASCLVQGSGEGGGIDYGPKTIRICDVDNSAQNRC
ncbi:MAG: pilus assembly protein TadG-related protein [Acidimicrobiales bacterium]